MTELNRNRSLDWLHKNPVHSCYYFGKNWWKYAANKIWTCFHQLKDLKKIKNQYLFFFFSLHFLCFSAKTRTLYKITQIKPRLNSDSLEIVLSQFTKQQDDSIEMFIENPQGHDSPLSVQSGRRSQIYPPSILPLNLYEHQFEWIWEGEIEMNWNMCLGI